MEVIWTKLAKITYIEVLENLKKRWTLKEMEHFKSLLIGSTANIVGKKVFRNI